ncbi:AlbA family DNA-binding domain-containing protein [Sinorhizobium psoraleae]|uniref:ATP-binding protein n=1 Tax=Sinorhizobium psoraleae TaxID=520838 RepID=A0ABT4KLA6_9HYPH|nr:ATP-binding protein [Sinorhizobium psoraleae]MCZ4092634.1 ATP-binding protein [Sinorhizobium psoraleae]
MTSELCDLPRVATYHSWLIDQSNECEPCKIQDAPLGANTERGKSVEVRNIDENEIASLLSLNEDHFNDMKSKRISPAKVQETFVAFANSDGGDLYIGVEDKSIKGERIDGFQEQEEANAIISTLLEETQPAVENVLFEFCMSMERG